MKQVDSGEYNFIDVHCHILDDVDDGAKSMRDSVMMLQRAKADGISCIICTPHYHPKRGHAEAAKIKEVYESLRLFGTRVGIRIELGQELFAMTALPERLAAGRVFSMCGSKTILVEFRPEDPFERFHHLIQHYQMAGYQVLLAHCERYQCLTTDMERVYELSNAGVKFQVNADSVAGKGGFRTTKFVKQLLEEDLIFCVGTDAHNAATRWSMIQAFQKVSKKYGEDYAKKLFGGNAAAVFGL